MSKMRPRTITALAIFGLALLFNQPAPAEAANERGEAEVCALIDGAKYLTAPNYTNERSELCVDSNSFATTTTSSAKQNGALYSNLAGMADHRNDQVEVLRRYERSLAAFKTMKEPPEGGRYRW